jgi:hypothetical protein
MSKIIQLCFIAVSAILIINLIFSYPFQFFARSGNSSKLYAFDQFGFAGYVSIYKEGVINQKYKLRDNNINEHLFSSYSVRLVDDQKNNAFMLRPKPKQININGKEYYFYSDKFKLYFSVLIPTMISRDTSEERFNLNKIINSYFNGQIQDTLYCSNSTDYGTCKDKVENFGYDISPLNDNTLRFEISTKLVSLNSDTNLIHNLRNPEDFQICFNGTDCIADTKENLIETDDLPVVFIDSSSSIAKETTLKSLNLNPIERKNLILSDKYLAENSRLSEKLYYDSNKGLPQPEISLKHKSGVEIKVRISDNLQYITYNQNYKVLNFVSQTCPIDCRIYYDLEVK